MYGVFGKIGGEGTLASGGLLWVQSGEGSVIGIFSNGKQCKGVYLVCLVVRGPLPVVVCYGCSEAKASNQKS